MVVVVVSSVMMASVVTTGSSVVGVGVSVGLVLSVVDVDVSVGLAVVCVVFIVVDDVEGTAVELVESVPLDEGVDVIVDEVIVVTDSVVLEIASEGIK